MLFRITRILYENIQWFLIYTLCHLYRSFLSSSVLFLPTFPFPFLCFLAVERLLLNTGFPHGTLFLPIFVHFDATVVENCQYHLVFGLPKFLLWPQFFQKLIFVIHLLSIVLDSWLVHFHFILLIVRCL